MRTSSSSLPRKRKRKDLSPPDTVLLVDDCRPWSVRHVGRLQCSPRFSSIVASRRARRDGPSACREVPGKSGTHRTDRVPGEQRWKRRERRTGDRSEDERRDKRRRSASKEISQDGTSYYDGTVVKGVLLLALLCAQCCLAGTEALAGTQKYSTRTVKTRYGVLRGIEARSSNAVETYYGVPYATPPLGALRYMPPVTPTPWRGTKIADTMPPACPQNPPPPDEKLPQQRRAYLKRLESVLANQSEDCLYLNLYVPKPPHGKSPIYYSPKDNICVVRGKIRANPSLINRLLYFRNVKSEFYLTWYLYSFI